MSLCIKNLAISKHKGDLLFPVISTQVKAGEVLTLMGPSGCGKSTLLSAIAGHLSPDFTAQGTIALCGNTIGDLPPHERQVGILFQEDLLFPHLNIWENLAFALPNRIKGNERKDAAMAALDKVGLLELAHALPDQISGGQRARVSLVRMLLAQPKLALLDEPFSKLDKELRVQFRDWVFTQLKHANIPTIMVTHDSDDVPPNSQCLTWPWGDNHA